MDLTLLLGNLAAFLTTASFLPQAIQTIRTRDTQGISLSMYVMLVCGLILWTVYGLLNGLLPIILANVVTFFFAGTILIYKLRATYGKSSRSLKQ